MAQQNGLNSFFNENLLCFFLITSYQFPYCDFIERTMKIHLKTNYGMNDTGDRGKELNYSLNTINS